MTDKKNTTTEEVENTMACAAFAEAGEPCPICTGKKEGVAAKSASATGMESTLDAVEHDLACAAFHEHNEPCPIPKVEK